MPPKNRINNYSRRDVEKVVHNLGHLEGNLGKQVELECAGDGKTVASPQRAKAGPELLL